MRAEILKINPESPETSLIRYAADQIRAGEVMGMPTDTFYGLAADPFNLRAVDRVYDIKSRSRHKPLSLLIESVDQAEELAQPLPEEFYALTRRYWPGPLTIIVKASSRLPLKVTANTGNVALRVPNAKIPLEVVQGRSHSYHCDLRQPQRRIGVHDCAGGARAVAMTASPSSSTVAPRLGKLLPPSWTSPTKKSVGMSCGREQSPRKRFRSSSRRDERKSKQTP